jgi:hypothetical protein
MCFFTLVFGLSFGGYLCSSKKRKILIAIDEDGKTLLRTVF